VETPLPSSKTRSVFIFLAPLAFILCSILIFNLLQQRAVYNATLNKVGFTYFRVNNPDGTRKEIYKIKDIPFEKISNSKLKNWDATIYWYISRNLYEKDSPDKFAFFPMFPILWKLLGLSINQVIYFNLALFIIGYFFFYFILQKNSELSGKDKNLIYLLLLGIPSLAVFAIPYAEATTFFIFSLALYFMLRKNMILTFIFFSLLAWCRPNTLMLITSVVLALGIFTFKLKKKEELKLPVIAFFGLLVGLIMLFIYYYFVSGNFWIFFEAQKNWGTKLQLPMLPFTDYAAEVFQINRLLVFIIAPLGILKLGYILFIKKKELVMWHFVQLFSSLYFLLTVLTVILFQGGSLHSLHRYIFATPLGLIFLVDLFTTFKNQSVPKKRLIFSGLILSILICTHLSNPLLFGDIIRNRNEQLFTNIGLILFLSITSILFWLPQENTKWHKLYVTFTLITLFVAMIWDSVLFNQFLSRGWLWA
jgi:hypothetical protein